MNGCRSCLDNAERAYWAEQAREAAVRCCETAHRPAYRRGRIAGQEDRFNAIRRAYEDGRHRGATRALVALAALGLAALVLGRPR